MKGRNQGSQVEQQKALSKLEANYEAMNRVLNDLIDVVRAGFAEINKKFDALDGKYVRKEIHTLLEKKVAGVETDIDALEKERVNEKKELNRIFVGGLAAIIGEFILMAILFFMGK